MKKLFTILSAVYITVNVAAQSPEKMTYQAVIRDGSNNLVSSNVVGMQISILQESTTGAVVYAETHTPTSNINGLVSIEIGGGTVVSGIFASIDWSNGPYFIKTETDPTGGTSYTIIGTSQLLSVPYALYAKTADSIAGGLIETDPIFEASPSFSITNDDIVNWNIDNDPTNEIQQLTVSTTGDTLYLQYGGFVIIPGISAANYPYGYPGIGITFDGYTYSTVIFNNGQEWMTENLKTTSYANGDPIPNVTDNNQWENLTTGAWVHYNNDSQYENPYGKLYNWHTVADPRNVCPTGWHVPSDAEWSTFINYLDPNANGGATTPNIAGGKMKSTGTQYWQSPNTDATNESGFSGLPGGYRFDDGTFDYIGNYGDWWSSTEGGTNNAWGRALNYTMAVYSGPT
jgi:uncharacterized protein (TIGR02145 family)